MSRRLNGSSFYVRGPAAANDRSPKVLFWRKIKRLRINWTIFRGRPWRWHTIITRFCVDQKVFNVTVTASGYHSVSVDMLTYASTFDRHRTVPICPVTKGSEHFRKVQTHTEWFKKVSHRFFCQQRVWDVVRSLLIVLLQNSSWRVSQWENFADRPTVLNKQVWP